MKKYEIWEYRAELNYDFSDHDYNYLYEKAAGCGGAELIEIFDTYEQAKAEFTKAPHYYKTDIHSDGEVIAYAIIEAEYDQDGEFIQGSHVLWSK